MTGRRRIAGFRSTSGSPARSRQDQLEAANTALRDWLGTDDVQGMQSRMRLAGTINYPKPAKLGRGYIIEPVTLRTKQPRRATRSSN